MNRNLFEMELKMKENNEVVSAKKDTKKLNAGIAYLCLQNLDEQASIPEKYIHDITSLADRTEKTELYNAGTNDEEIIEQCINLIEEYLKEQKA